MMPPMRQLPDAPDAPDATLTGDGPCPLGPVARHFGVEVWQLRRCSERGLLPPARHVGVYRTVSRDELPQVREALVAGGYLPAVGVPR